MTIDRRRFLATAGCGAAALSPLMNAVLADLKSRADGKKITRKRFVFLMKGNGLWADMIQPPSLRDRLPFPVAYDKDGRLENGKHGNIRKNPTAAASFAMDAKIELSKPMKSLEAFRGRISILQGIDAGFAVYHKSAYQAFGAFAAKRRDTSEVGGPTIDSVLAKALAGPVPHVCLGHDPKAASGVAYVPYSAAARNKPMAFYTKPLRAYKELFGAVGKGDAKARYDTQSEILDFFVEDAKRLQKQVAAPEREQLDRYLGAFESVRDSRKKIEAMGDALRKHAPDPPAEIKPDATTLIGKSNIDIAIASLASGLTNVVTIAFDQLGSSSYPSLGIGGLHGSVGHGQGGKVLEKRTKICTFHFEQIARLAKALEEIPEGDGTMLDNTVIVYTSNNGETHHSSGVNWPLVVLGDLGGKLAAGRYFAPGNGKVDRSKPGYTRLGDVWATLLVATGQSPKKFGRPINGVPHQPIADLLA